MEVVKNRRVEAVFGSNRVVFHHLGHGRSERSLSLGAPEARHVLFRGDLVVDERREKLVVERLLYGWRASIAVRSVPRSFMYSSKWSIVAFSGETDMCIFAAENPTMKVP